MKALFLSLLGSVVLSLGSMQPARAGEASTAYIVTYFETTPSAKDQARGLARELSDRSRKEEGNLRFEALQRIGQPNHFVILEAWKDKDAQAAHAAAAHTKAFREKLSPLLRSPYDERPHTALSIGAMQTVPDRNSGASAIYVVTHVDIVPTDKDKGIGFVKELSDASRNDAGNIRFEALQQNSRPNHMTVVEIWNAEKAVDAHGGTEHTKQFREKLTPLSGSLYDERLYKSVN